MFLQILTVTAVLVLIEAHRGNNADKTFFLQKSVVHPNLEQKLVVVTWSEESDPSNEGRHIEDCKIVHDQEEIRKILNKENTPQVEFLTNEKIEEILKQCRLKFIRKKRQVVPTDTEVNEENTNTGGIGLVWPGTKWCGAGNIAKNYDDLGLNADTDKCCRAHDLCPDIMNSGETKYNLTNDSLFTSLNCQCDQDFHDCLTRIDSVISNSIGFTYFNTLGRQCYQFDYPITKCKRRGFLRIPCLEYEIDKTAKVWHWVKAKWYNTFPLPGPLTIPIPV